jgi:tripartite-type tricarboxylate transporter receptor subunit TctC
VKDNRLKALAVTGPKRSPALPSLPTMTEAGVSGYEFLTWNGFFVPARTPSQVVTKLNAEIGRALALPAVRKRLLADGAEIAGGSPRDFERYVRLEREKLARVIKSAGIRIE